VTGPREDSAPAARTFRAPASGPVTLAVRAGYLELEVITGPEITAASAELSGSDDVTSGARAAMSADAWTLTIPETGPAGPVVITSGRFSTIIHGSITGAGIMIGSGGRIVVNGVDVTAAVSGGDGGPARLMARLPVGSSLDADVKAGDIRTRGALASVTADALSADLSVGETARLRAHATSGDIAVHRLAGPANVSATSGDVTIAAAAGDIEVQATSGDIAIHVTAPVAVYANATSGDVRVTADSGITPRVRARSVSGRVVCPPGARL
jgi:Putative adhesin